MGPSPDKEGSKPMPDYSTEENEGRAAKKEQPGGPSNTAVKIVLAAAGLAGIMLLGRATLTTERMSSGSHQKTNDERLIYHLVVDGEFQQAIENGVYRPDSLSADGFVHCAFKDSVVPVANCSTISLVAIQLVQLHSHRTQGA